VRFLVDEALQDRLAERLADAGHDASHVRVIGMQGAMDEDVLACADRESRVLVATDTDFGTILALSGAGGPSVLLLRGIGDTIDERLRAILAAVQVVEDELMKGAVAVIERNRVRIRRLPVDDS
jgi:predicted nuclease of predicted toxin-antitoxin system